MIPEMRLAKVRPGSVNSVSWPHVYKANKASHFGNLLDCLPAGDVLKVQPLHICLCPLPTFANSCAKETLQAKNVLPSQQLCQAVKINGARTSSRGMRTDVSCYARGKC